MSRSSFTRPTRFGRLRPLPKELSGTGMRPDLSEGYGRGMEAAMPPSRHLRRAAAALRRKEEESR